MSENNTKLPLRNEIKNEDKWDLSTLYASDEEWQKDLESLKKEVETYKSLPAIMQKSVENFLRVIEFDLSISRKIEKVYVYAHLKSDEDKTNQTYLGFMQSVMFLYEEASSLSSFITPEIMALDNSLLMKYREDERVKPYDFYIEKIIRYRKYTLSEAEEKLLSQTSAISSASSDVFSQLDNADLTFGEIDDNGIKKEITHGNFLTFLTSKNREIRKEAFNKYYKAYEAHKHTIATTHVSSVKADRFYASVRGHNSSLEKALYSDNVDKSVYENLISSVRSNLSPLFDYFRFKKEALGVSILHPYDIYAPVNDAGEIDMSYEEAVSSCVEAVSLLGDDYSSVLEKGLLGGWVDRYENKGKRSGAYSSGCYDSLPYILMNYDSKNINSLYTLTHEAGHSMHSYYSCKNQPYHEHNYSIFVAEVASTFNEALLGHFLMKKFENNPKMKVYLLHREIENLRATLVRQTMFAEFEMKTHETIEADKPLTLDGLTDIYRSLLKDYFSDTIEIGDYLPLECLRIPHFYSAFYVYKYATGVSAALALASKVLTGNAQARANYLKFLSLGGSVFPIDALKIAGVDMRSKEPIEEALSYMGGLVTSLKESYKELKSREK